MLDAAGNFVEDARVIGVVSLVIASQIAAQTVVKVVSPDSVKAEAAGLDCLQIAHVILVRLGGQCDLAASWQ